ncbi:hypothetical protein N7499_000268 [Penicillium canescens]|nr:hypothetical protein N7522_005843 [Penicillium canescens]KAJ6100638.1 hypothetical protein N7499_000268 [Penicillium canescens]
MRSEQSFTCYIEFMEKATIPQIHPTVTLYTNSQVKPQRPTASTRLETEYKLSSEGSSTQIYGADGAGEGEN